MRTYQFMPDLNEGLAIAIQYLASDGQIVIKDKPILQIKTEKGIHLRYIAAGRDGIVRTAFPIGVEIPVGCPLFSIDDPGDDEDTRDPETYFEDEQPPIIYQLPRL